MVPSRKACSSSTVGGSSLVAVLLLTSQPASANFSLTTSRTCRGGDRQPDTKYGVQENQVRQRTHTGQVRTACAWWHELTHERRTRPRFVLAREDGGGVWARPGFEADSLGHDYTYSCSI